jgi:hypothetical protein
MMKLFATFALVLALVACASAGRFQPHCDPERLDFQQRHIFKESRSTVDPDNTFWVQNMTVMKIDDIRDDTYHDFIKVTFGQKNWYDAENCRYVSDQAWPFGPGLWRMTRIYSNIVGDGNGNSHNSGDSVFGHPRYETVFSSQHLLWEHRSAPFLNLREQTTADNELVFYATAPGLELSAYNELITTIRPHEHAYYSVNSPPATLTSLPDWTWFHSHASTDPQSDFNQELKACFDGLDAGTLPRIQDPLAALEGAQWEISACFTGSGLARRGTVPTPTQATEVVNGVSVTNTDAVYIGDTAFGVLTRDHLNELRAQAQAQ